MKILFMFPMVLLFPVTTVQAQIVVFSFTGAAGNESSFLPDTQPANATVSAFSRGSGITAESASGTFNAKAWTTGLTLDTSDYYAFSITPGNGFHMSLSSLSLDERRSSTGIRNWSVRSSLDDFGADLSTFSVPDNDSTRTAQTTTLGSSFQNLNSGIEFRLYGFGAESGSGTWRIDNVTLNGSVSLTAVPEPHEYVLMTGIGLLLFVLVRGRFRQPTP